MKIGYMRVSRGDRQDLAAQEAALRAAGCERLFSDKASGAKSDREGLAELVAQLRPGDEVIVWKLDRVARSMRDLLQFLDRLAAAKAGLRSLTEHLDTTGPMGELVVHILGAFAQFERSLIRERTQAGLAVARAKGVRVGRRPHLTPDQKRRIFRDVEDGRITPSIAAREFKVSRSTITRVMAECRRQQEHAAA